jgi:5-methylcytosine-specific restriction endonuclease McrA
MVFNGKACSVIGRQRRIRRCRDCSVKIFGAFRCESCRDRRRKAKTSSWPSRQNAACVSCGGRRGKSTRGPHCASCHHVKRQTLVPCPRCGREFWPWADGVDHARKFCGCSPIKKGPKPRKVKTSGECIWCLDGFVKHNTRTVCCSRTCRARYQAHRRRLFLRGVTPKPISARAIYRRDGGICALCSGQVDIEARYPHPLSATVDHIVPISKGGEHSNANIQLAHAKCNRDKGNKIGGPGAMGPGPDLTHAGGTGAKVGQAQT